MKHVACIKMLCCKLSVDTKVFLKLLIYGFLIFTCIYFLNSDKTGCK